MSYDQIRLLYETYVSLRETPDIEWIMEDKEYERTKGNERKD